MKDLDEQIPNLFIVFLYPVYWVAPGFLFIFFGG